MVRHIQRLLGARVFLKSGYAQIFVRVPHGLLLGFSGPLGFQLFSTALLFG